MHGWLMMLLESVSFHMPESFTRRAQSISLRPLHWTGNPDQPVGAATKTWWSLVHHLQTPLSVFVVVLLWILLDACYRSIYGSMEHQNKHGCTGMILVLCLLSSGGCNVWILLYLRVITWWFVHTDMSKLVLVTLHVQGQVVRTWEAAAAGDALEWFGSGVFPVVSGELIWSGETPVTIFPCTTVRLLTCKREKDRMEGLEIFRTFSQTWKTNILCLFVYLVCFTMLISSNTPIHSDSVQLCCWSLKSHTAVSALLNDTSAVVLRQGKSVTLPTFFQGQS